MAKKKQKKQTEHADWSGFYKEEIRKVLPKTGEKVKAKTLLRKLDFSSVTVDKYLKELIDEGSVERIQESQKSVYYRRKNEDLKKMFENIAKAITESISAIPDEIPERTRQMADIFAEEFLISRGYTPTDEERKKIMSAYFIGEEALFDSLRAHAFHLFKILLHIRKASEEDFYISEDGDVVPARLVKERIPDSEIPEWKVIDSTKS